MSPAANTNNDGPRADITIKLVVQGWTPYYVNRTLQPLGDVTSQQLLRDDATLECDAVKLKP